MGKKVVKTWKDIDEENCTYIEFYSRIGMIGEESTGNIYFYANNKIVGELNSNGRIDWFVELSQNIKNEIRKSLKSVLEKSKAIN